MSVQTTTIEIDQSTAARLQARAEAQGMTLSALLQEIAERLIPEADQSFFVTATPEERAQAVEEWARQHRSSAPPLPDRAISRESIYREREDKQS